jgi:RNA polymerase sigma factor (sigma-70 family)
MINEKNLKQLFKEIIEKHKGILFKVAHMYCRDDEDRQDLIQEIKIQIWRSLHKYDDKYKITTWLYRISLNVAISFYRKNAGKKANTVPLDEQISRISEVDNSDKEHQLQLLDQFINELNDFDKALMLLYLEEKSHAEIADILGISVSNVSTKAGRIKDKLKKRFSNES